MLPATATILALINLPMDFSAWFQVYLGGRYWTVVPAITCRARTRVLMATGRDAADVAITTSFSVSWLRALLVSAQAVLIAEINLDAGRRLKRPASGWYPGINIED